MWIGKRVLSPGSVFSIGRPKNSRETVLEGSFQSPNCPLKGFFLAKRDFLVANGWVAADFPGPGVECAPPPLNSTVITSTVHGQRYQSLGQDRFGESAHQTKIYFRSRCGFFSESHIADRSVESDQKSAKLLPRRRISFSF